MGRSWSRQCWYYTMWTEAGQTDTLLETGLLRRLDTCSDTTTDRLLTAHYLITSFIYLLSVLLWPTELLNIVCMM